ncbi:hypothetical protein [Baekduia sp. Peel2402]|uniref:hypothetical protein n=1 Tax=Baekduia sp. Peel2402 TaxID=3458296 RepID=UPI00403EC829
MLAILTPKPFRGDVIAAGVVVLVTLVWTLFARFGDTWPTGAHLAYCAVACVFVGVLALRAPMEGEAPRAYQSVLYVATIALWTLVAAVLLTLVEDDDANSFYAVTGAAVAVPAFAFAIRRNSAACTLIGSLALQIAVLLAVGALWSPGVETVRWVLLAETVVLGFAAIGQRDRHLRHGVALIDAAGLAVVAIGMTYVYPWFFGFGDDLHGANWGWELVLVAAGFGLIAYSSVDRQPGPAYIGVFTLILFTIITSVDIDGPTLLGWPLALALAAVFLLVVGLRPTTPAPPPPDIDAPEPPPLPWR